MKKNLLATRVLALAFATLSYIDDESCKIVGAVLSFVFNCSTCWQSHFFSPPRDPSGLREAQEAIGRASRNLPDYLFNGPSAEGGTDPQARNFRFFLQPPTILGAPLQSHATTDPLPGPGRYLTPGKPPYHSLVLSYSEPRFSQGYYFSFLLQVAIHHHSTTSATTTTTASLSS